MSCYYCFYPLKKTEQTNKDGNPLYEYVGSYMKSSNKEDKLRAVPLEVRGESFIDGNTFRGWDEFDPKWLTTEALEALFGAEMIKRLQKEEDTKSHWIGTTLTFLPFTEENFCREDGMLRRGYVTIDEFDMIVETNYDLDYLRWEAEIKDAEYIAALPPALREKYVPVSFLDDCSDGAVCHQIVHSADMLNIWPFRSDVPYYILCVIG